MPIARNLGCVADDDDQAHGSNSVFVSLGDYRAARPYQSLRYLADRASNDALCQRHSHWEGCSDIPKP